MDKGLLSGVLPFVYSQGNVLRRKFNDALAEPMGTLANMGGNAVDGINRARQMLTESTNEGLLGGPATNKLMNAMADAYNPIGMTVWHGSPHKFNKFDSSKIGTGEGAQAYGHGLYLAEAQDTAQSYANKLTNVDGRAISDQIDGRVRYLNMLKQQAKDGDINAAKNIPIMEKSLAELQNQGSLYKVDLPDDQIAKMLDWDSNLGGQSPSVRDAINRVGRAPESYGLERVADDMRMVEMQKLFQSREGVEALRQAGIPGIRYLDGGSRGAGAGSSNFVVFPGNEGLLNILERNGQPINQLNGLLGQ